MKSVTISIGIILSLSSLAFASYAADQLNPPLNCASANTQVEMNLCAAQQAETAVKKLNTSYEVLQLRLTKDIRQGDKVRIEQAKQRYQKLVNAQNAWVKFRDMTCEYERSGFDGGSIAPMIYHNCMTKLSNRRTADLQEYNQEYL